MSSIKDFMNLVATERLYQASRWADGSINKLDAIDDEKNGPEQFTAFIAHHASRWFPGGFPPHSKPTLVVFQNQMVKVATIAFAAYLWAERALEKDE